MQNTSERYKMEIAQPSRKISGKITFPGLILDDTQIKNIEHSSALVHGEGFEIGAAPMGVIIIELIEDSSAPVMYDFEGQEGLVELGLMLPDESVEHIDIGLYTAKSTIKENNAIKIEALDRMHKAEKEYISDILYPATLLDILQSACDQVGIVLATTTFANADYVVPNEPVYEGITCRRIFAQVAELAGGYAVMNRQGELEILTLGATPVRAITKDNYFEFKRNEAAAGKIDKLIVKVGDAAAEAGTGDNIYTVIDNMFVQNPADVVDALYNVLKNVNYTACEFSWQGDFSLDLGDKVTIDGYETYILDRKLTYTGGLREEYRAPAKSNVEKESTGKGSLTLDIENVKTQIKVINGEIRQTIERVENLVVGASNRLYDSQTEIPFGFNSGVGIVQLFRDQIHPYYKVTSDQDIDLFAAFPDSQFAEPLAELGEVTISLDMLVDVDRTITIDGKEFDVKANRWTRIHVTKSFDDNTTKRLRVRNPFSRKRTRDVNIGTKLIDSLSTGVNTLYCRNLQVERGSIVSDWSLAPEELEADISRYKSEIRQLADLISLRVSYDEFLAQIQILADNISQKVSRGNVISEINQTAEMIKILAERIALEGLVTANDNFKILPDGSMEAKNGSFSGTVTGTTINGSVINGTEINGGEINGAVFSTQPTEQEYGVTIDRGKIRATDSQSNIIFNLAATTVTEGIPYRGGRVSAKQAVVLTPDEGSNMITILPNQTYLHGKTTVAGDFNVSGSKSRIVKTHNYGEVLHYALESPTPTFMDIGHGIIDIDGLCYIDIESIFSETIDLVSDYHIQLTKYGEGDIWVSKKQNNFFIVEGSPGLKFAWEIKAKQKGYSNERLEHYSRPVKEETDYVLLAQEYLAEYEKELIV